MVEEVDSNEHTKKEVFQKVTGNSLIVHYQLLEWNTFKIELLNEARDQSFTNLTIFCLTFTDQGKNILYKTILEI